MISSISFKLEGYMSHFDNFVLIWYYLNLISLSTCLNDFFQLTKNECSRIEYS